MQEKQSLETLAETPPILGFYDVLRKRIDRWVNKRGGRLGAVGVDVLLLAPDLFVLLVRLSLDRSVPASTRALLGGAIGYFVLPFDLFPEGVLGPGGFVEDLVLAAAILNHALSDELEPLAEKYWSGPQKVRTVLRDLVQSANALLGEGLSERLGRVLKRRGVPLRPEPRAEPQNLSALASLLGTPPEMAELHEEL